MLDANGRTPLNLVFLLLPQYSLMAFSSASEPLRAANRLSGRRLFQWSLISKDGAPVRASNNMLSVVEHGLHDAPPSDLVVVLASDQPMAAVDGRLLGWLRGRALAGTHLAAADTGAYALARSGLLNGYQATVHWEALDDFSERFPAVQTREALYLVDRGRLTAAGATACLDLMLHIVECRHGRELAVSVAEQFVYSPMRAAHAAQRHSLDQRLQCPNANVHRAVALMESRIEEPLSTRDLARCLGISLRELERVFNRWLGITPGAYYRRLRLERARGLLEQSQHSVTDIAFRCGFASLPSFSRCYRNAYGQSPSALRNRRPRAGESTGQR